MIKEIATKFLKSLVFPVISIPISVSTCIHLGMDTDSTIITAFLITVVIREILEYRERHANDNSD